MSGRAARSGRPGSRGPGDRGSVSLVVVAAVGLLLTLGAALGVVGAMVRAHRGAQSAADLASLAAAGVLRGGTVAGTGGGACGLGAAIARENGARLVSCVVAGREVRVHAEVRGPHWLGQLADLDADARAGPG